MSSNQTDHALAKLEETLGPIYSRECARRPKGKPLQRFETASLREALMQLKQSILLEREGVCHQLRSQTSGHDEENLSNVRERFRASLIDADASLGRIFTESKSLSDATSQLSLDFVKITDRLDSATSNVARAKNISTILRYILIFNSSPDFNDVSVDLAKSGFPVNDNYLAAEHISKLSKIVAITDQDIVRNAKSSLNTYHEHLVKILVKTFDDSTPDVQAKCVVALDTLGEGQTAVDHFINRLPIITDSNYFYKSGIGTVEDAIEKYQSVCEYFSCECAKIWPQIDRIFGRALQAKSRMIAYVFDNILQAHVTGILATIEMTETDHVKWCQTLENLYKISTTMCQRIWEIDEVTSCYDIMTEKLFSVHLSQYGPFELQNIVSSIQSRLSAPLAALDRLQQKSFFKKNDEVIDPLELFDVIQLHNILNDASIVWQRCALLSTPDTLYSNLQSVTSQVIGFVFNEYLVRFVSACSQAIKTSSSWTDVHRFLLIQTYSSSIINDIENKYNSFLRAILMKAGLNQDFNNQKVGFTRKLESIILEGLGNCIDLLHNIAVKKLSTQRKQDFLLKSSDQANLKPTNTCIEFCKFLDDYKKDTRNDLDGENKLSYLYILGNRIYDDLIKHLLSFKYNTRGGMVLILDVTEYKRAFEIFENEEINDKMCVLQDISHLMQLQQDNISDAIRDRQFSGQAQELADKMLGQRADSS